MINQKQLRELVVIPALQYLDPEIPYSEEAVELLMMTQAHESNGGEFLKQVGGPALGIYQMEPATFKDIFDNWLQYNGSLYLKVDEYEPEDLCEDLYYASVVARLHYYRDSEAIPKKSDYENVLDWHHALAKYAKRVWNTEAGKATVDDYFTKYRSMCL